MPANTTPIPAAFIPESARKTIYPEPFAGLVQGRVKRKLGDHFGLTNFGVNLTSLAPGAISALAHHHSKQDEFIYVLEGTPTLVLGSEEHLLGPGDCCGFKAGQGVAHQLVNRSESPVSYMEIGDRSPGESVEYPNDDLMFWTLPDGAVIFTNKERKPY
jgi:uncharacterized cupin superfamily protein